MPRLMSAFAITLLALPSAAVAQDLERTVNGTDRGTIRLSYATRPGVCGNEDNIRLDSRHRVHRGRWNDEPCVEGPAYLQLEVEGGRVQEATVRVGRESWPRAGSEVTQLGELLSRPTAQSLLALAEEAGSEDAGSELVFAAVVARDAELVRPLVNLARSTDARVDTREAAVFWLGNAVEEDVVPQLERLAADEALPMDVRESAIFALSQTAYGNGGAALMRIAQGDGPTDLRENAVFWLGQAGGPEVVDYLVDLARQSGPLAEKAVFALSQQDDPTARRALQALVADTSVDGEIRENAIFWLGQDDDEENFDFLREAYGQLQDEELKEKVIFSMSQMDSEASSRWLIAVARDEGESADTRRNALFWAGQSPRATDALIAMYDGVSDPEVKRQLIFVYSQRDTEPMLRKLMEIARAEPDHDLRENAIFWLGQSDAPEAMAFLEELINN